MGMIPRSIIAALTSTGKKFDLSQENLGVEGKSPDNYVWVFQMPGFKSRNLCLYLQIGRYNFVQPDRK